MKSPVVELIKELVCAIGPSGYEQAVGEIILREISSFGLVSTDAIGNIVCEIPGTHRNAPRNLFVAHQDEIGFMVSEILDEGFLRFIPLGGWNPVTLPSSTVDIFNKDGKLVQGTIGQISPHFQRKGEPDTPQIESMSIDIGASSRSEVIETYHINVGSIIVPSSTFHHNENTDVLTAKAFDDRIGVAALIELGRRVAAEPVESTTVLAFTTQEEVGTRGAEVLSHYIHADAAFIVEGAPADDIPGGPQSPQTCLGKGAHVRIFDPTHIGNPQLLQRVRDIVHERQICIQEAVRKGGGTDASVIALAGQGLAAIVVGVPVRYAHSHSGKIALSDFKNLVDLLYALGEVANNTGQI
jgi:endoglucanase